MKPKQKSHLCKCNNCETVMIDENAQVGAVLHELNGTEVKMKQITEPTTKADGQTYFCGCPICLTDDYLTDL